MSSPSIIRTVAPSVKIILSHAGGDFPHLITRVATTLPDAGLTSYTSEQMTQDAKKFYFDTALSSNKNQLDLLLKFVDLSGYFLGPISRSRRGRASIPSRGIWVSMRWMTG